MNKRQLKISIVIPAYNEESHIAACLRAISELDHRPYEVIVVDNNSTDDTAKIAEQFPFVTLVRQKKQGVVYARDMGFNVARGDIIARIDGDTYLPSNWTSVVENIFADTNVQAVSGSFHFHDVGFDRLVDWIEAQMRGWMAKKMSKSGRIFLNASNMALRKSAWDEVRGYVCHVRGIHEDLDLAIHLHDARLKVIYEPSLKANVSARRIDSDFISFIGYASVSPKTYIKHHAPEHIYMYPVIAFIILVYPILKLLFFAYDDKEQKMSLKQLLTRQSATRVNPAEFM